jgi:F-type H+-transporting ATPase subunit b
LRVVKRHTLALAALWLVLPATASAAEGLNLFPRLELLVLNVVVFLLLIYPVNRLLLQPLVRVLQEREARTVGALERAESFVREANESRAQFEGRLRQARNRAAERRNRALAEGQAEMQRVLERAREDAAQELDGVRAGVASELETARETLRTDAGTLAVEAAGKILGRPV